MTRMTLTGAATACVLSAAALPALAQDELAVSLWVPPQHPVVADLEAWGQSLTEASDGELSVTLFPAQQLGAAADHYDMARDGVVDMAMVAPGYTPGRFPIFNLNEMPFTFTDSTVGARVLHEWYTQYAAQEMPDVKVCMVSMHMPGTVHTKDAVVRVPDDMNGLKLRPAGPGVAAYLTALGASNVQATLPEVRELAERGVVDGVTFAWDIFVVGADTVLTHELDLPVYVTSQVYVINQSFYDGLDEVEKAAIDSHCTPEWSERIGQGWKDAEVAARQRMLDSDTHEVIEPTAEEAGLWIDAAAPVVADAEAAVTDRYSDLDGAALFDDLRAQLDVAGALYSAD